MVYLSASFRILTGFQEVGMWGHIVRAAAAIALIAMMTASNAAVYGPKQQLPAATIDAFKANPSQLLQDFPQGGAELISRVRDLGASDPTTLPLLIGLLQTANPQNQVPAIATGLAQLARLASKGDQAFATEIQTAIAQSGNQIAIAAYQASIGDVLIAALGGGATGGGAGAGTGGGGQTSASGTVFGGNTGPAAIFGGANVPNTFTLGTTSTAPAALTTTTTTTITNSVSPR